MNRTKRGDLSHLRKHFLRLQDWVRSFVLGVPWVIFITLAAWINGELDVFVLMMIWGVVLPGIILIFKAITLLSANYTDAPGKKIFYSGKYKDLIIQLFNGGFQLQSKIDDYYQFMSNVSLVRRHVLIVKKEGAQYSIFGEEEVVTAFAKDIGFDDLKIDVVNTKSCIKEEKCGNKFTDLPAPDKASAKNNITG